MRALIIAGVFLHASCSQAHGVPCPEKIRIAVSDTDSRPFVVGRGAKIGSEPGLLVSNTLRTLETLGCRDHAEVVRVPLARLQLVSSSPLQSIDIVPGVPTTAPIAKALVLPPYADSSSGDMSTLEVDFVLLSHPDRVGSWDGTELKLAEGDSVGVVRDSSMLSFARSKGWAVEVSGSFDSAWSKFLRGRSRYLLAAAPAADQRMKMEPGPVMLQPPVVKLHMFLAVSRDFYVRHTDFVHALWKTACEQAYDRVAACKLRRQK